MQQLEDFIPDIIGPYQSQKSGPGAPQDSKSKIYICKNIHIDCAVDPLNGPTKVSASFLLHECLSRIWAGH